MNMGIGTSARQPLKKGEMKKRHSLLFTVDEPIYRKGILVGLGVTKDEVNDFLRKKTKTGYCLDESCCLGEGEVCVFENRDLLIWTLRYPVQVFDYGTLQHEIFHAVQKIMEMVDIWPLGEGNCEAYAYLVGYLTQSIYKRMWGRD